MQATVEPRLRPEQVDEWNLTPGQVVEIVGFVARHYQTWVVWLDDEGHFNDAPMRVFVGPAKLP